VFLMIVYSLFFAPRPATAPAPSEPVTPTGAET
jgi:hypothetical protein